MRNKDRVAVGPIVPLTRPTVLEGLEEVTFVAHTVVPEEYRFWKSNQGGQASLCKGPIALKLGTQDKIVALNYDFDSREARVTELRLHQPVGVEVLEERNFRFITDVNFIAERASSLIGFNDLKAR